MIISTFRRIRFCISLSANAFLSFPQPIFPWPGGIAVNAWSSSIFSMVSLELESFAASGVDRPPIAPIANTALERNSPVTILNSSCNRFFSTC